MYLIWRSTNRDWRGSWSKTCDSFDADYVLFWIVTLCTVILVEWVFEFVVRALKLWDFGQPFGIARFLLSFRRKTDSTQDLFAIKCLLSDPTTGAPAVSQFLFDPTSLAGRGIHCPPQGAQPLDRRTRCLPQWITTKRWVELIFIVICFVEQSKPTLHFQLGA